MLSFVKQGGRSKNSNVEGSQMPIQFISQPGIPAQKKSFYFPLIHRDHPEPVKVKGDYLYHDRFVALFGAREVSWAYSEL